MKYYQYYSLFFYDISYYIHVLKMHAHNEWTRDTNIVDQRKGESNGKSYRCENS